ncbi:hypothetical protein KPH14_007639 [Odynerus spinipes]|uniref:Retrovirus-related Pol polyprotein from transposon TNT 1-94 n=1 Tax=Odynerus spinipes TaxID=1348599 RepID=A0AAD9RHP4_9HYME|nr:hypothetical protein KPH14_007639 [Odynerus spinipes]
MHRFGLEDSKTVTSPMDSSVKLSEYTGQSVKKSRFPYREAVGCLNYLATVSRPDISYVVGTLARYSNNPHEVHWKAVKRVMQYLKYTSDVSLCFGNDTSNKLTGYCDSDYAGQLEERKSTSGYVFLL